MSCNIKEFSEGKEHTVSCFTFYVSRAPHAVCSTSAVSLRMVAEDPKRWPHCAEVLPDYRQVVCPVLERIQPRLIQLKTNYFDLDRTRRQTDIIEQTIYFFE